MLHTHLVGTSRCRASVTLGSRLVPEHFPAVMPVGTSHTHRKPSKRKPFANVLPQVCSKPLRDARAVCVRRMFPSCDAPPGACRFGSPALPPSANNTRNAEAGLGGGLGNDPEREGRSVGCFTDDHLSEDTAGVGRWGAS